MMLFVHSNRMVYWTGQAEGMRPEGLGGGGGGGGGACWDAHIHLPAHLTLSSFFETKQYCFPSTRRPPHGLLGTRQGE